MPSQPNPARAKESAAPNFKPKSHQPLVITIDILSGNSNYTLIKP